MACLTEVKDMHKNYFVKPNLFNENVPEIYSFSFAV